jgi:hypothetical protein
MHNTTRHLKPITFLNPLLLEMSADGSAAAAKSAESKPEMVRENAFSIGVIEQTGVTRPRDGEYEQDPDLLKIREQQSAAAKYREEQFRAAMLAQARNGKYTQAQGEALGIANEKGFVPATCGYLKTEHVFERLDDERYEHPTLGQTSNHVYGKCIHCGMTEEFLRTKCVVGQRPSLYHCNKAHLKAAAAHKKNYFGKN